MFTIDEATLFAYRQRRYRQSPALRLHSEREAAEFLDEVGLCLFQPNRGVELPSLWGAVAGLSGPAPRWGQHDAIYNRAWNWKDGLFASGDFYYGKALGNYRLFASRSLLPHLWALSEMNYGGEPDDYLELYQDGKLSLDAKNVYQVLRERGPSSTTILRRQSGLVGDGKAWARFERALTELQRGLMVAAVGVARDNAWKYTFKYATLLDAFPQEVAAAQDIPSREAMTRVLEHYVRLAGATSVRQAARLFNWSEDRCRRIAGGLVEAGTLTGSVDDPSGPLAVPDLVGMAAANF
ncbi:MAG: AlkZ-related protein [Chloroflexota bacterium]